MTSDGSTVVHAGPDPLRLRRQQPRPRRHRPDHRHRRCLRRPRHLPGRRHVRHPVRPDRLRPDASTSSVWARLVVPDRRQPAGPGRPLAGHRPRRDRAPPTGKWRRRSTWNGHMPSPRGEYRPGGSQQPVAGRPDGRRGHRGQPARRVGGVDELGLPRRPAVFAQDEALYDRDLTTPAGHQGVTFVASTGDYGAADPEYPAFSPNVVAVGGTSLTLNADNSYQQRDGLGLLLERVGDLHRHRRRRQPVRARAGLPARGPVHGQPDHARRVAWWPTRPPGRGSPTPTTCRGRPVEVVGGTSLSAPAWAGLVALANQGRAAAGEPTLERSSPTETQQASTVPQSDYNDITSGINGYDTSAGYDLVTGLGTPVAIRSCPTWSPTRAGHDLLGPDGRSLTGGHFVSTSAGEGGPFAVFRAFDSFVVSSNAVDFGASSGRGGGQLGGSGWVAPPTVLVDASRAGAPVPPRAPSPAGILGMGASTTLVVIGLAGVPVSIPTITAVPPSSFRVATPFVPGVGFGAFVARPTQSQSLKDPVKGDVHAFWFEERAGVTDRAPQSRFRPPYSMIRAGRSARTASRPSRWCRVLCCDRGTRRSWTMAPGTTSCPGSPHAGSSGG